MTTDGDCGQEINTRINKTSHAFAIYIQAHLETCRSKFSHPDQEFQKKCPQCPPVWIKLLENNHHHEANAKGRPEQVLAANLPKSFGQIQSPMKTFEKGQGWTLLKGQSKHMVLVTPWTCLPHAIQLSSQNSTKVSERNVETDHQERSEEQRIDSQDSSQSSSRQSHMEVPCCHLKHQIAQRGLTALINNIKHIHHKGIMHTRSRYHGVWRPSSNNNIHSPTVSPPSTLDKLSIMKCYHHRQTCSHTSPYPSPTMVTLHDTRFVECRWWNDGWTVKTVVTWQLSASMIPAPDIPINV